MLRAEPSRVRLSPEEREEGAAKEDVAVIPLGIPMLAGPGAIATVTLLMSRAWPSIVRVVIVAACILLTGVLTFVLLRAAGFLERALKQTGLNILNRLMGLLLAAIAAQFVVDGLRDSFPVAFGPR
jgi:multiple antibiotic resistance protein